jgi:hypothetical protein
MNKLFLPLFLLFVFFLTTISAADDDNKDETTKVASLNIEEYTISVNSTQYFIKGVYYSPNPTGNSPLWSYPWGDLFTADFIDLWERDFPLIVAMGGNTIRISSWNNNNDHGLFLDTAHKYGLKVIITYNLGNSGLSPVAQEWQRQNIFGTFSWQVSRYLNHPAILAWSFGAEINGNWNGFLRQFADNFGCYYSDQCYGSNEAWCKPAIDCVYTNFFNFLNIAADRAKQSFGSNRPHLIMASFADVDNIIQRLTDYEHLTPQIDAWGMQLYRGKTFGEEGNNFIEQYAAASTKPLIITETGIDAYYDSCGDSSTSPCYNTHESPDAGAGEDQQAQAEWISALITSAQNYSSLAKNGPLAGIVLFEWTDEWWKSSVAVRGCYGPVPYGKPGFEPGQCEYKAHADCPFKDLWWQSLCGFPTPATFDHYANVAWFGIMKIQAQAGDIDRVVPRLAYRAIQALWKEQSNMYWLYILIACLGLCIIILMWIYRKWQRRLEELQDLGIKHTGGLFLNNNNSNNNLNNTATESQPLLSSHSNATSPI